MHIFGEKPKTKVLFVASEAAPFAKAGGLGEVMFSLPKALKKIGYDARVMVPRYAGIDQEKFRLAMEYEHLEVPTDAQESGQPRYLVCNVKKYEPGADGANSPVTTYFLENLEYYERRANVYGYADDAVRWALLGRGVLEFLRMRGEWIPDVIVACDWQAAFVVNYLKTAYQNSAMLGSVAAVFSIHNLYYQGMFDHKFVAEMDYDAGQASIPSFFDPRLLKLNMMRRGIMHANAINTVSPTYANEIMTPEYGELLDGLLRERRSVVYGILNGIDYEKINPSADPHLAARYDAGSPEKRIQNKLYLQERFNLPKDPKKFVIGIVSRLDEQKGFDIFFDTMEPMLRELGAQLIVVGAGEAKYMSFFAELQKKYPQQVAAHLNFDAVLPHFVFGGADAVLLPSRFEPSGLVQMEAMRYGAIPVARKTGGLADTIEDCDPESDSGTGFVFKDFGGLSFAVALSRASEAFRHKTVWRALQQRAMRKDFSWQRSAQEYAKLFEKALDIKRGNVLG